MQIDHNADGGLSASFSRRNLLQIAAAGTAAAFPAAAVAATAEIPQLPLTDEEQVEACIVQLKKILGRMHPDFPIADGVRMIHGDGGSTVFVSVKKPLGNPFDGDGDYEVKARAGRYAAGIYHIRRVWSDADEKFLLWGAYHWDGFLIAPREIIAPADLVRKIEGNAT